MVHDVYEFLLSLLNSCFIIIIIIIIIIIYLFFLDAGGICFL